MYENTERLEWDNAYWMCIGTVKDSPLFFAYCSDRCGTGFGLGETSTLYLAKTLDEIVLYALTDAQRDLVRTKL